MVAVGECIMSIDIDFILRTLLVAESGLDFGDAEQVRGALQAIRDELTFPDKDVSKSGS